MNDLARHASEAVIEGYPTSPAQTASLRDYSAGLQGNSTVVLRWDDGTPLKTVEALLRSRIAGQAAFGMRVHALPSDGGGLQIPGEGTTDLIITSDPGAFEEALASRFALGSPLSLRAVLFVESGTVKRLGLVSPPYISDEHGLALLLAGTEPSAELSFQHFSEWCREADQEALPRTVPATEFDVGQEDASRGVRRAVRIRREDGTRTADAAADLIAVASAAVLPLFADTGNGPVSLHVRTDGRIFEEFKAVAGPFRLTFPISVPRMHETVAQFRDALAAEVVRGLETWTVLPGTHRRPHCLISVASFPERDGPFAGTVLEAPEELDADVHVRILVDGGRAEVSITTVLDGVDERVLQDLCARTVAAIDAESVVRAITVSELGGLRKPTHLGLDGRPGDIISVFKRTAETAHDRAAFVVPDRTYTFAELASASAALASKLAATFARGDRILIFADRSFDAAVAMFGVLGAGMTCVPILKDFPDERVQYIARVSAAAGAVVEPLEAARAEACVKVPVMSATGHPPAGWPAVEVGGDDEAYILFTSGSTGQPKGVVVQHYSVVNLMAALKERIHAASDGPMRLSVNAPLAFDAAMKQFFQIAFGHTLVPIPADVRADPEELIKFVSRSKFDAFDVTPTILRSMVAAGFGLNADGLPKRILVGGEAMDQHLWDWARGRPDCEVWNVYGPTEATVNTLVARVRDSLRPSLGHPLSGVSVAAVDRHGYEVPSFAVGELQIGGLGVAKGYIGASATEDSMFQATVDHRSYASGDIVRRRPDDGYEFLGRRDDQVKVGGQRLELGEIEAKIRTIPGVLNAAVVLDKRDADLPQILAGVVVNRLPPIQPSADELLVDLPTGHRITSINIHETKYQYKEIFEDKIYVDKDICYPDQAIILDVGANIGLFSLFASQYLPHAEIFAFEPLAPIREKLSLNMERYCQNVRVFPFGLSNASKDVEFTYFPGYSMMSSQAAYTDGEKEREVIRQYLSNSASAGQSDASVLLENLDEVLDERFRVEIQRCTLRRLSDVIDELALPRIDLLKIDVQRAELDVLLGLEERHLSIVRAISMELHDDVEGATSGRRTEISTMLETAGFRVKLQQDPLLAGTDRWNLVAYRDGSSTGHAHRFAASSNAVVSEADVDGALRRLLPGYMLPHKLRLLDDVPRTPQGKIDKTRFLALFDEQPEALPETPQALGTDKPAPAASAARAGTAETLLGIWREVLRKPNLTTTDNFFNNGGDSIRAILMQSKARAAGITVSLKDLHASPTIAGLIPEADAASPDASATVRPVSAVGHGNRAETLLGIWREVLRKPNLTTTDNFFNNGGDSIRAILMQSKARAAGITVSLKDLHASPTIAGLIPETSSVPAAETTRGPHPTDRLSPASCRWRASSMQKLMLLASMVHEDAQVFHNATITPVRLPFDERAFHTALLATRNAHPIMTARIEPDRNDVVFVFDLATVSGDYRYEDLRSLTPEEQEKVVRQRVLEERASPFDLSNGSLVRFLVLEHSREHFDILIAEHHAALDGFSLNAVTRELVERYRQLKVPSTDDVRVFSAVLVDQDQADASDETKAFWRSIALDRKGVPHIGRARPISQAASMQQVNVIESARMYSALNDRSRHIGVSVKGILFALHIEALRLTFGNIPAGVGAVFSLRPEVEGSLDAVGNFLNVLPVPVSDDADWESRARAFDAFDRSVYGHRSVSHERLLEWLGSRAEISSVYNFIQFAEPDRRRGDKHDSERRFFAVDAMMPLSVDWDLSADHLHLGFQYDANRIDEARAEQLKTNFRRTVLDFLNEDATHGGEGADVIDRTVLEIISREIGVPPDPKARLAELGVHSLGMVVMARHLMQALGATFALGDFLRLATVQDVLAFCRNLRSAVRFDFVELTPNRDAKVRIIGIPPVGAAPSIFDTWCDFVPEQVSVHAFRYPDFTAAGALPGWTLAGFTDALAKALQPLTTVSTVFVGSSLGAILAYEAACRMGSPPAALVIVGSAAPGRERSAFRYHLMDDAALRAELARLGGTRAAPMDDPGYLGPALQALRTMSRLATTYQAQHKILPSCQVTAVWPRADVTVGKNEMIEWSAITRGKFSIVEVDGEHSVLLDDPHGVYLAAGVESTLASLLSSVR